MIPRVAKWWPIVLAAALGLSSPQFFISAQDKTTESLRALRAQAEQGGSDAQFNLGLMYYRGEGVPQDYVQAHMWYNLAGISGDAQSVKNRDFVAEIMTPSQIAEAQRLAREWKPKRGR